MGLFQLLCVAVVVVVANGASWKRESPPVIPLPEIKPGLLTRPAPRPETKPLPRPQVLPPQVSPLGPQVLPTRPQVLPAIIDACTVNPCKNGGKCKVKKNGKYKCKCKNDYSGDNCETAPETTKRESPPVIAPPKAPKGMVGSECKKSSDCKTDNAECFKGTCLCTPGFYFSKSRNICTEECLKLASSYTAYPDSFFKKNKLFVKRKLSQQECKTECSKNTKCLSFSYMVKKDLAFCYFHDTTPRTSANFKENYEGRTFFMSNCI